MRKWGLFSRPLLAFKVSCVLEAVGEFLYILTSGSVSKGCVYCYRLNPRPKVSLKLPGWFHCSEVQSRLKVSVYIVAMFSVTGLQ